MEPEVEAAVDRILEGVLSESWDIESVGDLADLGDPRIGWLLADLMRFYQTGAPDDELVFAFSRLTGAPQDVSQVSFVWAMNHLIAWDLPAWEGYAQAKRQIYTPVEDTWTRFFDEDEGVDWRLVTWGGVLADQRPLGDNGPCNCIPALDYPETTDAAGGDWYDDDRIVFGVVVEDEAIALPKHQMEIHEMVNLTLGGRELGIPYCTLCASAQAYYVDDVSGVDRVVLRTSGLLSRSNKFMYDLTTGSAINTFTGEALTGSLAEEDVTLEQVSVVASTWDDWKKTHPDTRILAEDGGIGRSYGDDPLGGRDDDGPIFPVGNVDPPAPDPGGCRRGDHTERDAHRLPSQRHDGSAGRRAYRIRGPHCSSGRRDQGVSVEWRGASQSPSLLVRLEPIPGGNARMGCPRLVSQDVIQSLAASSSSTE